MTPSPPRPEDLADASLDELRARYPAVWEPLGEELLAALGTGRAEEVAAWVEKVRARAELWRGRLRASGGNPAVLEAARPHLVRERMARLALEKTTLAAAARRGRGPVRLGLWSGTIIQRLLFSRGLVRKPASLAAARLLWPLVPGRRVLMPLVQPRGIYCFYSRALVRELARLAAGRPCLELAAGDGTLARFLAAEGVAVTATDDGSWPAVTVPDTVERVDARTALRTRTAPVVLCSFPPAGNGFERAVFTTPGVELYVVVTTRHRFAAGDWRAYDAQRTFTWSIDERLSRMVLPPEVDPAVLVFRRAPP